MGDDRYARDASRFEQRDPLTMWSLVFLIMGAGAVAWMLLVFFLLTGGHVSGAPDSAFGLTLDAWVTIAALLLGTSIVGLLFTILARLGATEGGGYITTLDEDGPGPSAGGRQARQGQFQGTTIQAASPRAKPAPPEGAGQGLPENQTMQSAQMLTRSAARVETAEGSEGRMLLSYTIPEDQPRGLYGDTYVPVDSDVVLNIKTLLAKTPKA